MNVKMEHCLTLGPKEGLPGQYVHLLFKKNGLNLDFFLLRSLEHRYLKCTVVADD